jgi:hypothetical protein
MTTEERYARFIEDMEAAGYEVRPYEGRHFYHGPAIRLDDRAQLQDAIRATALRVQWDELGRSGLIVYPC